MEIIQKTLFNVENNSYNFLELDFSNPVGDPMVEIGRLGLIEFCKKDKFGSFNELENNIKKLFKLYAFNTKDFRIGQIFSSNSKFTNQQIVKNISGENNKKAARVGFAMKLYSSLNNELYEGYCITCGKENNLCSVSKTIFPLITGKSNVNFTSSFSNQFLVCKSCMTSLFFTVINMQKSAGNMTFLISNNNEINKYWSELNLEKLNFNIASNSDLLIDSKTNIFQNFIYETIQELQEEELFGDITFYLLSNVDKGSSIELIHIYEKQLKFLKKVSPKFFKDKLPTREKNEWNSLTFKYASKERKINGKKVKFEDDVIVNKNYKNGLKYFNPLINSFINNKSILGFLKRSHSSWHLTQIYLKEIKGMRKERLEVLKKVADNLQKFNNNDDKQFINKVIFPIEKTKSQSEFREKLRSLMRKYLLISEEPLFSTDEMVFQILPSGENWQETKDILLIALYEKLTLDDELKEEIEKNIDGGDNNE